MIHFSRQYSSASPVVIIQPQPYYQTQLSAGTFGRQFSSHVLSSATPAAIPRLSMPARFAGRKRSHDEASINLEPDITQTAAANSPGDRTRAEGMVLIKPPGVYVADTSIQPSTWIEKRSDEDQRAKQEIQKCQLELRSNKSQRLNYTTETAPLCNTLRHSASTQADVKSAACRDTIIIDKFTIHLGIGWRKISNDEHIQAAARGWARFIENNFGLAGVRICLESKGLQSYLVETSNGYFLFAENLRHGRFVSSTAEGALHNLQLSPPRFEGPELGMITRSNEHVDIQPDTAMAIDL